MIQILVWGSKPSSPVLSKISKIGQKLIQIQILNLRTVKTVNRFTGTEIDKSVLCIFLLNICQME